MNVVNWNKPASVKRGGPVDGGPDNGYTPQMSDEDARSWKGKVINSDKPEMRIELRKTFDTLDGYAQCVITIGKHYKSKSTHGTPVVYNDTYVRISSNGTMEMTGDEFNDMMIALTEAFAMVE